VSLSQWRPPFGVKWKGWIKSWTRNSKSWTRYLIYWTRNSILDDKQPSQNTCAACMYSKQMWTSRRLAKRTIGVGTIALASGSLTLLMQSTELQCGQGNEKRGDVCYSLFRTLMLFSGTFDMPYIFQSYSFSLLSITTISLHLIYGLLIQ